MFEKLAKDAGAGLRECLSRNLRVLLAPLDFIAIESIVGSTQDREVDDQEESLIRGARCAIVFGHDDELRDAIGDRRGCTGTLECGLRPACTLLFVLG